MIDESVTNEDILAIFREKDTKIMELEDMQHKMRNTISSLTSNLRDSRIRSEHLEEKISMLTTLLKVSRSKWVPPPHPLLKIGAVCIHHSEIGAESIYLVAGL